MLSHLQSNQRNIDIHASGEGKGNGLDICYSATYMSQTRDQQRFTISEVAADWHEPMVPQCIMWLSIVGNTFVMELVSESDSVDDGGHT